MVEKGNVWMLGMMLLEVCTLREGVGCYDGENYDVLHGEVEERLEMVREFYPREMGEMLRGMLRYEWRERVVRGRRSWGSRWWRRGMCGCWG